MFLEATRSTIVLNTDGSEWLHYAKLAPKMPFRVHFNVQWVAPVRSDGVDLKAFLDHCRGIPDAQMIFERTPLPAVHNEKLVEALNAMCKASLGPETTAEKEWQTYYNSAIEGLTVTTQGYSPWRDADDNHRLSSGILNIYIKDEHKTSWMQQGGWITSTVQHWMSAVGLPGTRHGVYVNDIDSTYAKLYTEV
ncbi:hypothetical protein EK21DRAFT_112776 [Setomelanomma holmii]|uniref:Uncharacterized protein n=1 Tax=Setomelanomma holmii TaxID=210430 RepID=A0A9P4LJT8_9PLEO|nr:hypothetical protein EK21DRAFT_112776 [Setomelanomma holmii]